VLQLPPYLPPSLLTTLSSSLPAYLLPFIHPFTVVSIVGKVVEERSGNLKDTGSLEHTLPLSMTGKLTVDPGRPQ